jgi:NTE family protein
LASRWKAVALGLAHIGVLKWFEENRIPIDRIAGTSMGALVGGLYASGLTPKEIARIATGTNFGEVFTLSVPFSDEGFRRRQDAEELPGAIRLGLKGGPSLRNSLLEDRGLDAFLQANFDRYNRSDLSYNSLPIPFRCVATDLTTMEPVVFDTGPIPESIRASIAIPAVFSPVEYHTHFLVDGAIMDNLPTDIVKRDLHADVVLAVHLNGSEFAPSQINSLVGIFARSYSAGVARNERAGEAMADVLISAGTEQVSTGDYSKAAELIEIGYIAAGKNRDALVQYALSESDWQSYLADRQSRRRPKPAMLEALTIEGGSPGAQAEVRANLNALAGHSIDPAKVTKALVPVQGNGTYQTTFETFAPNGNTPVDQIQAQGPDTGVLVKLNPVRNGPPFLLFGTDITAANSNVTRTTFDFRFIDQSLGGFGSELRGDLRLGFLTQGALEYYRQLTPSGYYIEPHIGILRQPVYIWENQVRVSERLSQNAGGGFDIGRTFNRYLQTSVQWRSQVVRWHLVNGEDGEPTYSGTAQSALAHFVYNSATSGSISPAGTRIEMTAGSLFHTVGSQDAPLLQASFARSYTVLDKNIFGVAVGGDTYFRRNVAEPLRFTLGGPLRLSASSIDEYRGTDDILVRAALLRRVATLPSGVGQGLYLSVGYEGGEIWAPERSAILRQDGVLTGIAVTPIGVIKFGGAIGDAGRRKAFFSLGRIF